jgi:N-acyl homoserine lactone hydrolase
MGQSGRELTPLSKSLKMTKAGDIILVSTSGHTEAHISVILKTRDVNYFFAGDTSYNQDLMLRGKIDGVSVNNEVTMPTTLISDMRNLP